MSRREQQSRPATTPDGSRRVAENTIVQPFEVHGILHVDLSRSDAHEMGRQLQMLAYGPRGSDVVIHVAPRQMPTSLGVAYLRQEGRGLRSVTVDCSDPDTIRGWVRALRGMEETPW